MTDLPEFSVTELVRAQPAEGSVQLQQLQAVAVQPPADEETREARRQEEQGADVPLIDREHRQKRRSSGVWVHKAHSILTWM